MAQTRPSTGTILIVGASRGLGHAMAAEYLKRGWTVIGTVRGSGSRTRLHDLADASDGRLEIEVVDICAPDQVTALRERLSGRSLDTLFVNAGVTNDVRETIAEVTTDEFVRVMVTNALSPLRVIEALQDLVPPTGLIGVMSSGQGSIANNETGMREVYRGSKAALNMFMRSFAARHSASPRAMVAMAPGWPAPTWAARMRGSASRTASRASSTCSSRRVEPPACDISTIAATRFPGDRARDRPG